MSTETANKKDFIEFITKHGALFDFIEYMNKYDQKQGRTKYDALDDFYDMKLYAKSSHDAHHLPIVDIFFHLELVDKQDGENRIDWVALDIMWLYECYQKGLVTMEYINRSVGFNNETKLKNYIKEHTNNIVIKE